jgi:hypothetical protein
VIEHHFDPFAFQPEFFERKSKTPGPVEGVKNDKNSLWVGFEYMENGVVCQAKKTSSNHTRYGIFSCAVPGGPDKKLSQRVISIFSNFVVDSLFKF